MNVVLVIILYTISHFIMPDVLEQISKELIQIFRKSGQLTQKTCISTISRVSKQYSLASMPQLS